VVTESVFLGLVTHPRTRFPESSSPQGLVAQVAGVLDARGIPSSRKINDQNLLHTGAIDLSPNSVRASIDAEMALEARWRAFQRSGRSTAPESLLLRARRIYRRLRLAPPWRRHLHPDDAGMRMLTRLANIELSHLDLMHAAVDSGASWALIVEDDAHTQDVEGFTSALIELLDERASSRAPLYVNMSRSFTQQELGVLDSGVEVGAWSTGDDAAALIAHQRPVTNTVCAILYRVSFLRDLLAHLDAIPLEPIVPIDWKLNAALMSMSADGSLQPEDCWSVEPAPLIQRSMLDNPATDHTKGLMA
jgi:hypothetical protein